MNTLEFISSIVSSLAWPIAIIVIVWLLKDHLIDTFSNIKNLKYKDIELNFSDKLSKAEIKHSKSTSKQDSDQNDTNENVITLAKISPSVAVLFAWSFLEKSLVNCRIRLTSNEILLDHEKSPNYVVRYLIEKNYIDEELLSLIKDLKDMRNIAAHQYLPKTQISYHDAINYYKLIKQVTEKVDNIS